MRLSLHAPLFGLRLPCLVALPSLNATLVTTSTQNAKTAANCCLPPSLAGRVGFEESVMIKALIMPYQVWPLLLLIYLIFSVGYIAYLMHLL
jgi:hypothetical protein